jgi:hypothetical protein
MNNFCIATCFFSVTKLLSDSNKILEHLLGGYTIVHILGVYSYCMSKFFLGGSRWNVIFFRYPRCRNSAYVGDVHIILIFKSMTNLS